MLIKSEVIHTTCPYCNNSYNVNHNYVALNRDKHYGYSYVRQISCLNCFRRFLIFENNREIEASEVEEIPADVLTFFGVTRNDLFDFFSANPNENRFKAEKTMYIRPLVPAKPVPAEVNDAEIVQDFNEACMTLEISPRASAALSRRCMQNIFTRKALLVNPEAQRFTEIIKNVIASKTLPSELLSLLNYVVELGNFSAEPVKDEYINIIFDASKEEAELNLDVIQRLFDIYYVYPAKNIAVKEGVEEKLRTLGKNIL